MTYNAAAGTKEASLVESAVADATPLAVLGGNLPRVFLEVGVEEIFLFYIFDDCASETFLLRTCPPRCCVTAYAAARTRTRGCGRALTPLRGTARAGFSLVPKTQRPGRLKKRNSETESEPKLPFFRTRRKFSDGNL